MSHDPDTLSLRIKARLEALNKSASAASLEAGLGRSAIQAILSGGSESPRLITLQKLTGPLACSLEYLIGFSNDLAASPFPISAEVEAYRPIMGAYLHHLEADVFRAWPTVSEVSDSRQLIYRGDVYQQHRVVAHILLDNSMEGIGLLKGDVITATSDEFEDDIELKTGTLVVCERHIKSSDLYEKSLRLVRFEAGGIILETAAVKGENRQTYTPIIAKLPDTAPLRGSSMKFNVSEDVTVVVMGVALRATRRLIGGGDPRID